MKEFDAKKTEDLMKDLETIWSLIARYQNHENDYFLDMVLTPKRVRLEQEIIDKKISNQSDTDRLTESIMKAAENNDYEEFIKSVQKGADIMHTNFSVLDYFIRHK